ncbi:MAG: hypothetical protein R2839_03670 [Thermomicrobiales bacterium]
MGPATSQVSVVLPIFSHTMRFVVSGCQNGDLGQFDSLLMHESMDDPAETVADPGGGEG